MKTWAAYSAKPSFLGFATIWAAEKVKSGTFRRVVWPTLARYSWALKSRFLLCQATAGAFFCRKPSIFATEGSGSHACQKIAH
jgi:hypothetical protein